MKKGVWVVLVIAILVATGAFVFTQKKAEVPTDTVKETVSASELLKSATLAVPDSDATVTLVDGEAFFDIDPRSSQKGDILFLKDTSAMWEKDGHTDVSAVFAVNSGGSGTFIYLVLFDLKDGVLTKKSEVLLGDRINVTHIGIGELVNGTDADYRISVTTLIRKDGDPYVAEPTVEAVRTFYVNDQTLKEVEVGRDDT